jgi:hypothetical protein
MRSKADIERTLKHMKTDCPTDAATNAVWIAALEWVLGDDAHRAAYDDWLRQIEPPPQPGLTIHEIMLRHSLFMALERLR